MMADLDDTFFQEAEQGVTTLIAGMCGISAAPFSMEHLESCLETAATVVHYDFSSSATKRVSYAGYLDMMDRPLGTNMAVCVGHGTLRAAVMGMADREPDPAELEHMKAILQECMEAGALGISYGLQYPAGCYAGSSELAVLSSISGVKVISLWNPSQRWYRPRHKAAVRLSSPITRQSTVQTGEKPLLRFLSCRR